MKVPNLTHIMTVFFSRQYLVYVQLPFAEDEHVYRFPSLEKTEITADEMKVVDNLLNAMDLDEMER